MEGSSTPTYDSSYLDTPESPCKHDGSINDNSVSVEDHSDLYSKYKITASLYNASNIHNTSKKRYRYESIRNKVKETEPSEFRRINYSIGTNELMNTTQLCSQQVQSAHTSAAITPNSEHLVKRGEITSGFQDSTTHILEKDSILDLQSNSNVETDQLMHPVKVDRAVCFTLLGRDTTKVASPIIATEFEKGLHSARNLKNLYQNTAKPTTAVISPIVASATKNMKMRDITTSATSEAYSDFEANSTLEPKRAVSAMLQSGGGSQVTSDDSSMHTSSLHIVEAEGEATPELFKTFNKNMSSESTQIGNSAYTKNLSRCSNK